MWINTGHCILDRPICAYIEGGRLLALDTSRSCSPHLPEPEDRAVLDQLSRQLEQYLAGNRQGFDLPVALPDSPWRQRVFNALAAIPYGQTVSYGDLARLAGNAKAARAVASAMSSNPLPLLRACHRVVPVSGQGYGEYRWGVEVKQCLVDLESRNA